MFSFIVDIHKNEKIDGVIEQCYLCMFLMLVDKKSMDIAS